MISEDVLALYTALHELGIQIWIDGGWGVDALLGEQTRPHQDLDIASGRLRDPGILYWVMRTTGRSMST